MHPCTRHCHSSSCIQIVATLAVPLVFARMASCRHYLREYKERGATLHILQAHGPK